MTAERSLTLVTLQTSEIGSSRALRSGSHPVKSFVGLLELSVDELLDRGRSARSPAGKRLRREFGQAPSLIARSDTASLRRVRR